MWQVVGQERAVTLLQRSLKSGSLAHAYLFVGPAHVGKMTLAINLAQALNCEAADSPCGECTSCQKIAAAKHADVQIIDLGGGEVSAEAETRVKISVEQIEQLQRSASLPPFEGKHKVFILDGVEFLSIGAANRLLKTLEEPESRVIFLLLTTNEHVVPATIVSRCQRVELAPLAVSEVEDVLQGQWGVEPQKAKFLARLCRGCLGWAVSAAYDDSLLQRRAELLDGLLEITDADNEERFAYAAQLVERFNQNRALVQERLDLWLEWWRDLMLLKAGCNDAVTNIDRIETLTQRAACYNLGEIRAFIDSIIEAGEQLRLNANPQLVLEVLMLSIPDEGRVGHLSK
jgi:DNA polymerase-3 subunit delta'